MSPSSKPIERSVAQRSVQAARACACSGYLLSVNPFNQPGVESYKKNMFALLGKPGFESERARLEQDLRDKE